MKVPKGFLVSGVNAGIRKDRPDLALVVAERGASAAAVFTTNRFQAAPVVLSRRSLARTRGRVKAVVVNAGCANAVTGEEGLAAARRVQERAAELLSSTPEEVFVASTGVIGVLLPDEKVRAALPAAVGALSASGLDDASRAILTTDVGPKVAGTTVTLGRRRGRIVGFAKGAGMIHPNMATMLAFVMTDVPASASFLRASLKDAVAGSFNAISVDGDTSTNDTVLLMSSGALDAPPLADPSDARAEGFRKALADVCRRLAYEIVRDGEGATRIMEITVTGGRTERDARLAAHAVGTSPLVKTALFGGDPNWGRILGAVGRSGARFDPSRVSLRVGTLTLVRAGQPVAYRERDAARIFLADRVPVAVDLGAGKGRAFLMASDLGHAYVSLNADYRS